MKLAYQKCELSGCHRRGSVFKQSDITGKYLVVCVECAQKGKKKKPVGSKQGSLV